MGFVYVSLVPNIGVQSESPGFMTKRERIKL